MEMDLPQGAPQQPSFWWGLSWRFKAVTTVLLLLLYKRRPWFFGERTATLLMINRLDSGSGPE
jgi:hypothetical protein